MTVRWWISSISSSPAQYSNRSPRIYKASALIAVVCRKSIKLEVISGRLAHRCKSEINKLKPDLSLSVLAIGLATRCAFDNHIIDRYVLMALAASGCYFGNFVDYFGTSSHFTEYCITPATTYRCSVVQEV